MEFEGRIQRVLPVRSGTSQRGEWKALPFVFEYFESQEQRWSDKVLLETFDTNIMTQIGVFLKKGPDGKAIVENDECVLVAELKCKIGFSHSVRTFERQDGTKATVNDLRLYKFEVIPQFAGAQPQTQQPAHQPHVQMPFGAPQQQGGGETDDLPF
jgi:hypothetical protein